MYKIHSKPSLRSALLLGAASAAAISFSVPALAQDSGVETVVVTGSRIPQVGLYSSSPVTAVGQQEMKFEGTTNVENLLNNLPQVSPDFGSMESNGATGTATVDLRSLGAKRTLVLIDGKRLMPGDPTDPVADLNQIPAGLVDHVEVLTGGASAVYGSDALAGVVNFIMRKDFEGVEVSGNYSVDQHDNSANSIGGRAITAHNGLAGAAFFTPAPSSDLDGTDVDGTIMMGANSANGKGNVTIYAGYRNTQAVLESSRDFSDCALDSTDIFGPLAGVSNGFGCLGSSNSAVGNIRSEDAANPHEGHGYRTTSTPSDLEPYVSTRDAFNFAPYNYLQRPDTRYTLGGMGHYEVSKSLDIYGSAMFMDDHTVAQIAPSGFFRGSGAIFSNDHVNCNNPFLGSPADPNSAYSDFCAPLIGSPNPLTGLPFTPTDDATLQIGFRFPQNGDRQDNLRHTSYRLVWGAKGDLGGGWAYDISAQYGTTIYAEEYLNDASITREQNALEVVSDPRPYLSPGIVNPNFGQPVCKSVLIGADPNCVPLDIFTLNGQSKAALDYISENLFKEGSTEERIVSGSLTGDLGQWGVQSPWAKSPLALSLGSEYRQEGLDLRVDDAFKTGDGAGQGGATPSVDGQFDVVEGFGEVRLPLVQDQTFFEDLTLNGGFRYSSYSNAGSVTSYKYGAEWQPIDDFRLRASFQRAVRAPNVNELFTPRSVGLWGGGDPCGSTPQFTAAQCANTNHGVPMTNYGSAALNCPVGQCSAQFSGNAALKPETSDTRSLGIVLTPTFLDGFTATFDYFDIDVDGAIGIIPESEILAGCAVSGSPFFCNQINRATGSEIIFGNSGYVIDPDRNLGFLKTKGLDIEANYTTDLNDWGMGQNGSLSFNLVGTWTNELQTEPVPPAIAALAGQTTLTFDCAGKFGAVCGTPTPRWKDRLRVTWNTPWDVDLSLAWRHIGSVRYDQNFANPLLDLFGGPIGDAFDNKIPNFDYFDLAGTWNIRDGVEIHAGVNNIFDKNPPIVDSTYAAGPPFGNGNTFPQVYDALGRFLFVGATIKY